MKWQSVISPCGFRKIRLQKMLNILHMYFIACLNIPLAMKINKNV